MYSCCFVRCCLQASTAIDTNISVQYNSFVCTQLNGFKHCDLIQLNTDYLFVHS